MTSKAGRQSRNADFILIAAKGGDTTPSEPFEPFEPFEPYRTALFIVEPHLNLWYYNDVFTGFIVCIHFTGRRCCAFGNQGKEC